MKMKFSKEELSRYVAQQLNSLLAGGDSITPYLDKVLDRVEKCFAVTNNKYYHDKNGQVAFSVFHSGQYSIFLYYLANTIHRSGENPLLATKVYYLNKILHSVDWYHEIELPEYWAVEHPLGSVLGRAKYSNGFYIYQGCTVGGNKGKYPTIGKNVILYSNVTVLGDTYIGDNVIVSTGTTIKDERVPDNCMVFGKSPNLEIKSKGHEFMKKMVDKFWISK